MGHYKWLFSLSRTYIPLFLLSVIGSVIQSLGATALTLLVKHVVDDVLILKNQEELLKYVLLLFSSALVIQLGFFTSSFTLAYISEKVIHFLRSEIYEKILYAPVNNFLYTPSGELISRIVNDLEQLRYVFSEYIPKLLREPLLVVTLFGVLLYRDVYLTLFILLLFPLMALFTKYFSEKKKKYLSKQRENLALLTSVLSETLRGFENVKIFLAESRFIKNFKELSLRIFRSSVKINLYVVGNTVINYTFGYAVVSLILFVGGYRIVKGEITTGDFISFLTALFMIQKPLMETQKAVMNVRGSTPIFERIRKLLSVPREEDGSVEFKGLKERILFRNVSVKINGREILKNVNIEIYKGAKVGIRGHTGSGKSTFVKLIPRLLEYEGEIFIDETELRDFKLKSLREKIGFLSQEVIIFRGTVKENLLIAKPNAKEEEMLRALELARCDFILNSKEGLDKFLEEGGKNLSGGEKQRLALARIFLKNPDIVILDEATSALDPKTEEEVIYNLYRFFKEKTIFAVAHRPFIFNFCDLILDFEEGKLKEFSTSEENSIKL